MMSLNPTRLFFTVNNIEKDINNPPLFRMSKITCFISVLTLVVCVCPPRAAELSVTDLLNRVRSNQDLIKSGDLIVKTRHQVLGNEPRSYGVTFHIEFDGEKIRVQRDTGERTTVYCSPYLAITQSFFFASRPEFFTSMPNLSGRSGLPEPVLASLILYERSNFDKLHSTVGIAEDTTIPCVKTMGFVTDDIFSQKRHFVNLSTYLRRFEGKEASSTIVVQEEFKDIFCSVIKKSTNESLKGSRLEKVEVVDESGNPIVDEFGNPTFLSEEELDDILKKTKISRLDEIWLDPTKNYAIRRMVMKDSFIKVHFILENDLKLDVVSGCWYPASWTFEEYRGDQLRVREENTLEVISINKKIDPKRFTLESLGDILKPGTPVEWKLDTPPPGKGKLEWDGKKIFAHGEFGENFALYGADPDRAKKRWIIIICVNVAIISAIFAIYYYLRLQNL